MEKRKKLKKRTKSNAIYISTYNIQHNKKCEHKLDQLSRKRKEKSNETVNVKRQKN